MKILCLLLLFTIIVGTRSCSQNNSTSSWAVVFESTLGERYWTGNGWTDIESHAKRYRFAQIPPVLTSPNANIFDPQETFPAAGQDVGAINELDCVNLVTRELVAPCMDAY